MVSNYHTFEYLAMRSSNIFATDYAHSPKVYPCGSECSENGIAIVEMWTRLIYEDVADSSELYMDFIFTQSKLEYNMKFHNVTRYEYDVQHTYQTKPPVTYTP